MLCLSKSQGQPPQRPRSDLLFLLPTHESQCPSKLQRPRCLDFAACSCFSHMQHATCKIRSLVIAHSLSMCIVIMYFVAYLCLPNRYSGNLCRSFSFWVRLLLSTKSQPQVIITKRKIHHDRKCPPINNYKLHIPNSMFSLDLSSFFWESKHLYPNFAV